MPRNMSFALVTRDLPSENAVNRRYVFTALLCGGCGVWDMSDFRARLFQERIELHQRIEKLKAFILGGEFESLPEIDRDDLREQLGHMEQYFSVVDRRASRLCNDA